MKSLLARLAPILIGVALLAACFFVPVWSDAPLLILSYPAPP